jgi:group I intron endonuclease
MKTGIYKILNTTNNKVYIGSATHIEKRWRDHKWYLNHNIHHNSHLQSSWNKYGAEVFEFIILLECRIDDLLTNELKFILAHNSFDNNCGYNVNDPEHKFLNRKHSEKTKQKLSLQKLGDKNPMFGKCGDKHHNFNKKFSLEERHNMSLGYIGIPTHRQTNVKLKAGDIIEIRKMYHEDKLSQPKIATIFNVTQAAISNIILKKSWSHVV